jgi:hypothetical protein
VVMTNETIAMRFMMAFSSPDAPHSSQDACHRRRRPLLAAAARDPGSWQR